MRSKICRGIVDGQKVEIDALRLHLAGIERQHAVIEAAGERHRNFGHVCSLSRPEVCLLGFACRACPNGGPRVLPNMHETPGSAGTVGGAVESFRGSSLRLTPALLDARSFRRSGRSDQVVLTEATRPIACVGWRRAEGETQLSCVMPIGPRASARYPTCGLGSFRRAQLDPDRIVFTETARDAC